MKGFSLLLALLLSGLTLAQGPRLPEPPYPLEGPVYSYNSPPLSPRWFPQGEKVLRILLPKGGKVPGWVSAFLKAGWKLEVRMIQTPVRLAPLAWGQAWALVPDRQGWRWETKNVNLVATLRGGYEVLVWSRARPVPFP